MPVRSSHHTTYRSNETPGTLRIHVIAVMIAAMAFAVVARLGVLMIRDHAEYQALAAGIHESTTKLLPVRGQVYTQDTRTREEYPLAMNRTAYVVFADTTKIKTDEEANRIANALAEVLGYDDERKLAVYFQLKKVNDPYEPIEKHVEPDIAAKLKEKKLPGIGFVEMLERYYPEGPLASHVIGFLGKDKDGNTVGRYGIEGYYHSVLAGSGGLMVGAKTANGRLIPLADQVFRPPEDGADILLTIDRTLQYETCERLRQGWLAYEALSASLIIADPKTGAIRAMCSFPDFDPNNYSRVESASVYNNTTIFVPYEPGSIFKPIGVAAAINENLVTPNSPFFDPGVRTDLCSTPIQNADGKKFGDQTMTGILVHSINTGMAYIVEQLGKSVFRDYVANFGFGVKEGITLDTEVTGTVDSLKKNKGDKVDCYTATASFGQGITVTPLQMVAAYGAIANGGLLMKPYIVDEIRYSSGRRERVAPTEIRRVIEPRTASLVSGMLVSVIDSGEAKLARVPGYYVAGKTGTAQIAEAGKYKETFNHSFVGFGPVDDPRFVIFVKFEEPNAKFASATAAPVFRDIAKITFQYYQIPPGR